MLIKFGLTLHVIAKRMRKSIGSVKRKTKRLGLEVVVTAPTHEGTTTSLQILKELPTV
jgi:hypothetical protein